MTKWISMEDKHPELRKDVLVTNGEKIYTAYYSSEHGELDFFHNFEHWIVYDVTHWTELSRFTKG